ncbi:Gfo/Idh/MocA family protein [Halomontanus rarus]|uniref:Gfo/Idh/MocA family protein n=1 Tax=Halomontanus rarus TaxID=3034020 RepID=UPI0023E82802|nr:Gfo/Idh/MocA family oxidoreductase [Halovivax sp. TS33]
MAQFTAAVIGTGPEPDNIVWGESAAMAYRHGEAYEGLSQCDIVGCADIVRENAEAFADEFDIADENVYEDYQEMLHAVEPDVVSICTPVPTHAQLVIGAAETEVPRAIHCEKPMADTWADCKRMADAADDHGVQLTFNHQRRFSPQWQEATRLLEDGVIGDLERVEMGGKNLYDYGSHLVDLCNHFAGEQEAEWVLGQVHYTDEDVRYGVHNENQGLVTWRYDNGVHGVASTGFGSGADVIGCEHRLFGSEGILEVNPDDVEADLRYRNTDSGGWETFEFDRVFAIQRALEHVCDSLETGDQPVISAEHALRATEIIFAAWESARQRGRIELPLEAEGNALTEMVDAGDLTPVGEED